MAIQIDALLLGLHLVAAAAWFGGGWFERLIMRPVLTDGAGADVVRRSVRRGGGARWFAPASLGTVVTGFILYWRLGIDWTSVAGAMVTLGAAFGVTALALGITVHGRLEQRLRASLDEDDATVLAHARHLQRHTTFSAWLVTGAFFLMAFRHVVS